MEKESAVSVTTSKTVGAAAEIQAAVPVSDV
jgi:hypothetical protein